MVVSAVPFHFTIDPEMKLLPLTVNVNELDPATAEEGLIPVIVGVGLLGIELSGTDRSRETEEKVIGNLLHVSIELR